MVARRLGTRSARVIPTGAGSHGVGGNPRKNGSELAMEGSGTPPSAVLDISTTMGMTTLRLAQPRPRPEGLLAHARRIATIALRSTDAVTGDFLIEKAEEQYAIAIQAFESRARVAEANNARAEMEQFSTEARFELHDAPVLAGTTAFRRALDALAASEAIGRYYNGTDNVDEIVTIARKRMANRDRLGAAEDATRAATCLLWRAEREEEAISLFNDFTDTLLNDVVAHLDGDHLYLVDKKADIVRKRLLLTGRKDEAENVEKLVSEASQARPMASHVS